MNGKSMRNAAGTKVAAALSAMTIGMATMATAGPTPEQKCEGGKNGAAGKYAACVAKAESGYVTSADAVLYAAALAKCESKYVAVWAKLEEKAVVAGTTCPSTGDQAGIQDFLDACTQSVAVAVGGGSLPLDPIACNADLTICDSDLSTCSDDLSSANANLGACNGNLGTCNANLSSTNADLGTCNGNLGTCNSDLSSTNADFGACNGNLGTCSSNLSSTNADLGTCNGNLGTCSSNLSSTNADLGACNGNLGTCNSNLTSTNADLGTCNGNLGTCNSDLSSTNADLVACDADLSACESNPTAAPLKTQQVTCYTAGGAATACAGTRQDGDVQPGVTRSYTDNSDGTITDNATGLMWEKLSDDGSIHDKDNTYIWNNAFALKIGTLNTTSFAGHNDWRVPTIEELQSLNSYGYFNPSVDPAFDNGCTGGCTVSTCSCTAPNAYWSSTTYLGATASAWTNYFTGGLVDDVTKGTSIRVRAVRTSVSPAPPTAAILATGQTTAYGAGSDGDLERGAGRSFTDNGDGTITDNVTGLMWEKKSDDGSIHDWNNTYSWSTGTDNIDGTIVTTFLATLNGGVGFAGHTDWRIPNRHELDSLLSLEANNPATYAEFQNSCTGGCTVTTCSCTQSAFYWSSTTYRGTPSSAWLVYLYAGDTDTGNKTSSYYVRAVRAGS